MSNTLSILTQQLSEAQAEGDLPRQIALASAMLKERVSDADRLYMIVASACRELVIANDPSDLSAVLGWYQTWYRHTRDPDVRICIDETKARVDVVAKAEKRLNDAVVNRNAEELREAIEVFAGMPERLNTTNVLLEQGKLVLREQIEANKKALTDRIRRSDVLRKKIYFHLPKELDLAFQAYTTLLSIDVSEADDPELARLSTRMAVLRKLHEALAAAQAAERIVTIEDAIAALSAHEDQWSTTATRVLKADDTLKALRARLANLQTELSNADQKRPDILVPIMEGIIALSPSDEAKKKLDAQEKLWYDLRAWHAVIAAADSTQTDYLALTVQQLRSASGRLSDSTTVLARGDKALKKRQQARRRTLFLRVGLGGAAAALIIGTVAIIWRDQQAYNAITAAADPATGLVLAEQYSTNGHFFYHDDVARAQNRLGDEVAENQLASLAAIKDVHERLTRIEQYLANPDIKQRSTFIDLRDQTVLEIDDQGFATANAHDDRIARMAALQAYADKTVDASRAEQAHRTIVKIVRQRDDEAWTAIKDAKDTEQRLLAIAAYLDLPEPAKQAEAIAARNQIQAMQARQTEIMADEARWEKVLAITDPAAGIAAVEDYLTQPGSHAVEATKHVARLRRALDDQLWQAASVDGTPQKQIERARAYLQHPGERAHDAAAQALLANAIWREVEQISDPDARLVAIKNYLSDPANQAFRTQAKQALTVTENAMDDQRWQQALALDDVLERARAMEIFIAAKSGTRHQLDAVETLTVMARDMVTTHPDIVVTLPMIVLTRIPINKLSELSSGIMLKLPLSLQMQITIKPVWSSSAGVDAYGRWALFTLGSQHIRLRYIPAGKIETRTSSPIVMSHAFWIAETEITQAMWVELLGGFFSDGNPSIHKNDDLPVHNLSRNDCDRFLKAAKERLEKDGQTAHLRLPTIDEWRYTAISASEGVEAVVRGVARSYSSRDLVYLAYAAENGAVPAVAGGGRRDAWGLLHMLGNVGEWVALTTDTDAWWTGGNWLMPRAACLPEALNTIDRTTVQKAVGLRLIVENGPAPTIAKP